jgi:cytochrome c oxidase accessory protein FixG
VTPGTGMGRTASLDEAHERFRDALASVQEDGRRRWIHARQPRGRRYTMRTAVAVVLLVLFFAGPFVTRHGQPVLLLDIVSRRFIVFGLRFWPQDFYLLVLCVLTGFVTIALVTSAVGRIWCGWLCPQTVFLEMVFRRLEWLIDGSAEQQLRRARAGRTPGDVARALLKHAIFLGLSFLIANVFLAYVIGADALREIVTDAPARHVTGLFAITTFSAVFYAVFARFREQACTLACPYGRVMGALVDADTLTVTYDGRRGEPRHRRAAAEQAVQAGDCVDCGKCVTVCPTGIDIRNGIQLECVACTACADACDDVMRRVGRPPGLIRYTSETAARTGAPPALNWRVKAYAVVWVVLAMSAVTLIARRPDLDVLLLRQPGTVDATLADGQRSNFYTLQIVNRSSRAYALSYRVIAPAGGEVTPLGSIDTVTPYGLLQGRLLVRIPADVVVEGTTPVRIEVRSGAAVVATVGTSFLALPRGSR